MLLSGEVVVAIETRGLLLLLPPGVDTEESVVTALVAMDNSALLWGKTFRFT